MADPTSNITEVIDPDLLDPGEISTTVVLDQSNYTEFEVPVLLNDPFGIDLPRFVPNFTVMTLERFVSVADQVIKDAQSREQTVVSERVKLVEQYPAEEMARIGDEAIVFKVKYRKPAMMSTTGKSRPARGYMQEYTVRSAEQPNKILIVEKRLIDHEIEFACWSKNATLANRRALWLERLLVNNRWAFKIQGADKFFWTGRSVDTYQTTNGQRLYVRPLTFFLRIPEFRVKAESVIKHVTYQVQASDEQTFQNSVLVDKV